MRRLKGQYSIGPTVNVPVPCVGHDPLCPCQDGDLCHYKGENPWPVSTMVVTAIDIEKKTVTLGPVKRGKK